MASQPLHPTATKEKKRIKTLYPIAQSINSKHAKKEKKAPVSLAIIYIQGRSRNNNNRIKVHQSTLSTDKVF